MKPRTAERNMAIACFAGCVLLCLVARWCL